MSTEASRARGAVAALFMVNGAMTGNLVPRFADLKADLELSNIAFGSAVGALLVMPAGAVLVILLSRALSDGGR